MPSTLPQCLAWMQGYVLIALTIGLASLPVSAGTNTQFIRLLTEQGVSVGSLETIHQDRQGYLWFGGLDGLLQYDGYHFTTYRHIPGTNTSLSSNVVWDLHEDRQGQLWIATDFGLNRFERDQGNFTRFMPNGDANAGSPFTRSIAEDTQGNLWIASFGGLIRMDAQDHSFRYFVHDPDDPQTLSSNELRIVHFDRAGNLWIGSDNSGLNRMDIATGKVHRYPYASGGNNRASHGILLSILEDRSGIIWVGTDGGGLDRLDPASGQFEHFHYQPGQRNGPSHNTITDIREDADGYLWLATEGGLNRLDPRTREFTHYVHNPNQHTSLSSNVIRSLLIDNNQDLWVGTFHTGANFLDTSNLVFKTWRNDPNNPDSPNHPSILSFEEDAAGNLWLGTDGGGLNRLDRQSGKFTHFIHDPQEPRSLSAGAVLGIEADRDGSFWLGTWRGGLNHLDPQRGVLRAYTTDPQQRSGSLSNDNVWSVLRDRQDNLWLGTVGGGLNRLHADRETVSVYRRQYGSNLSFDVVWTAYEDHRGQIWIGTGEGLGRYVPESDHFVFYRHDDKDPHSLSFNVVLDITEDQHQRLWLATRGGGVNMFDQATGRFVRIGEADGLPSNVVNSLVADDAGYLWLGSSNGLTRFDPDTRKVINFTEKNGLQGNQFNIGTALKMRSGELVFGGNTGFTLFDPTAITLNEFVPPVAIVDFQIFNKPVLPGVEDSPLHKVIAQTDSITLTHHQSVFSFSFVALSYRNPEKNQFAFMMEGFEQNWNYVGADRRNATYTNLNPGTYVFRVKAANNQGVWNNEGKRITIHILPPPWKTWWAYTLYALVILGLLLAFVRAQHKKVLNERKINKRLQQLDKLKDEFLANTSHELRTPLNGIIGLAESLVDGVGGEQSDISRVNLEMIISSGKRLERLVNTILDFSKLKEHSLTLNRKPLDMHALTNVVFALSQPALVGKPLQLVNAIPGQVPLVDADEDRVLQIMHNLIGNAIKFTKSGTIHVSAAIKDNALEICVRDSGIGITPAELPRIFDSFHQVEGAIDRHYSGTGLGLAVTRQLVELHGGQIHVESTPGSGSRFRFTLPLRDVKAEQGSASTKDTALSRRRLSDNAASLRTHAPAQHTATPATLRDTLNERHAQFHILVVDDELVNRQVLINHLSLQHYRVTPAVNGAEAMEIAGREPVDLILLDVMMPGMSGYDVCKQIRLSFSSHELPVIFLTAKTQINDLVTGFALGANDFLTKPVNRDELLARVHTHLTLLEITRNLEKKVEQRTGELQQKHQQLEEAYRQLEAISLSDPLTGLSNRRYLQKLIPMDIAKVQREYEEKLGSKPGRPTNDLAFFLLDVDFFKPVNDLYGHMAGDQLLIQFSELLTEVCRESDCLVRWGGEEFLIVSRFSNRDEAPRMAERIRHAIEAHTFVLNDGTRLQKTCSIGYACFPFLCHQPNALSWEQVIDTADRALYAAKKSGRNRSVGLAASERTPTEQLYQQISDNTHLMVARGELTVIAQESHALVWE